MNATLNAIPFIPCSFIHCPAEHLAYEPNSQCTYNLFFVLSSTAEPNKPLNIWTQHLLCNISPCEAHFSSPPSWMIILLHSPLFLILSSTAEPNKPLSIWTQHLMHMQLIPRFFIHCWPKQAAKYMSSTLNTDKKFSTAEPNKLACLGNG